MSGVPYTWPQLGLIEDGEAVRGRVPNRPIQQLAQRTEYLKQVVDNIEAASSIWLYNQTISSEVTAGDAVYFDNGQGKFRPARASVTGSSGSYDVNSSTYAQGIVHTKLSDTSAHIILRGYSATLKTTLGLDPGDYYLSGTNPGALVSDRPAVAMYVCTVTSSGVFVNPTVRDILEDHQHLKFDITGLAAGVTIVDNGNGTHSLSGGNSDSAGWMPASNSVFNSTAPAGAEFGYNISANSRLQAAWPPQPTDNIYIERDGVGIDDRAYRADENGLWWMTNCDNQPKPWTTPEAERSSSSSSTSACPPFDSKMTLWFTKLVSATNMTIVETLAAETGSPITIEGCDGTTHIEGTNPGAGALVIRFTMPWSSSTGTTGSTVVKDITGNGVMSKGSVVEGIKVGSGLSISGGVSLASGATAGTPTLDWVDPTSVTRELDVQIAALDRTTEELYNTIPVIGFPYDVNSALYLKVRVPTLSMTLPQVRLYVWAMVPAAGTPPTLPFSYKKLSVQTTPGGSIPSWTSGVALATNQAFTAAGQHVRVASALITVVSNDILLFKVERTNSSWTNTLYLANIFAELVDSG